MHPILTVIKEATALSMLAITSLYLLRDWKSHWQQNSPTSSLGKTLRSTQALLLLEQHRKLFRLEIYRDYLTRQKGEAILHHLSHRHYLAKGLSLQQRIQFAFNHYDFESTRFNDVYKRQVYSGKGLVLWSKYVGGTDFRIALTMGQRETPEGDLCVSLLVNGLRLHSMNFSWITGAAGNTASRVVPYITRNQGTWPREPDRLALYEQAFPNNSPRYFCLAALQGIARTVEVDTMLAVSSALQICAQGNDSERIANSYDVFWESLGATKVPFYGYAIPIPFCLAPLAQVAAKHRKRAAMRRSHWKEIEESAVAVMAGSLT